MYKSIDCTATSPIRGGGRGWGKDEFFFIKIRFVGGVDVAEVLSQLLMNKHSSRNGAE